MFLNLRLGYGAAREIHETLLRAPCFSGSDDSGRKRETE